MKKQILPVDEFINRNRGVFCEDIDYDTQEVIENLFTLPTGLENSLRSQEEGDDLDFQDWDHLDKKKRRKRGTGKKANEKRLKWLRQQTATPKWRAEDIIPAVIPTNPKLTIIHALLNLTILTDRRAVSFECGKCREIFATLMKTHGSTSLKNDNQIIGSIDEAYRLQEVRAVCTHCGYDDKSDSSHKHYIIHHD